MSQKGQRTTADYLPIAEYWRFLQCLHDDGLYRWEAYCKISFCTALRVTDVRTTCWKDILNISEFIKVERKTGKTRIIQINRDIRKEILQMYRVLGEPARHTSVICNPRTGQPYSSQYINRKVKWFRWKYRLQINRFSTHTFRKTFGRYAYESLGRTPDALVRLSQIFNHKDIETTRRYIGLDQEDIAQVFDSLRFRAPDIPDIPLRQIEKAQPVLPAASDA